MNQLNRNRTKIGIALGAGVARGWAHIGVMRVLSEAGVHADIVSGTSIGGNTITSGTSEVFGTIATGGIRAQPHSPSPARSRRFPLPLIGPDRGCQTRSLADQPSGRPAHRKHGAHIRGRRHRTLDRSRSLAARRQSRAGAARLIRAARRLLACAGRQPLAHRRRDCEPRACLRRTRTGRTTCHRGEPQHRSV